MTYRKVYEMVSSIEMAQGVNIPCAYFMFPDDKAPPPPFLVYYYPGDDDFKADDKNYAKIRQLTIELYCDNKNFLLEKAVEDALASNGFVYSKAEDYIETEKLYMTTFDTEVIING